MQGVSLARKSLRPVGNSVKGFLSTFPVKVPRGGHEMVMLLYEIKSEAQASKTTSLSLTT